MSEGMTLTIGNDVSCSDGVCGELLRVVVDPVARALTHLVVQPRHPKGVARLVPMDLVTSTDSEIALRCTLAEFDELEGAEATRFLPEKSGHWGYSPEQMYAWPYYGLGMGGQAGAAALGVGSMGGGRLEPQLITYDRVPKGEVEVRRGQHVEATDGPIGHVKGLIVDPVDDHVTHVLLDEGHLWGHKQVAIPIRAVSSVEDGVRLSLTKDDVRDLPPVQIGNKT